MSLNQDKEINLNAGKAVLRDYFLNIGHHVSEEEITICAEYIAYLEERVKSLEPKEWSAELIASCASTMRLELVNDLEKQMTWKPSCKDGGAKFSVSGICFNPGIMASFLSVDKEKMGFKMKKFTVKYFQDKILFCEPEGSGQNSRLRLIGTHVKLRWDVQTGYYKWTGQYGLTNSVQIPEENEKIDLNEEELPGEGSDKNQGTLHEGHQDEDEGSQGSN